ncbi:MAG: leucine-rich repeat protein [Oscillospiraceae bacterium]|nr:leucine-rich repeat protein [Oscillospiraceae bacterium]
MNTQINIDKNGTTTLATAGKYCDRNIDVNVDIIGDIVNDADLILDGSFSGGYFSDKITELRDSAFESQSYIESVSLPNCIIFQGQGTFRSCIKLKSVYLPNLTTIVNTAYTFSNSKITELDLPNLTSATGTALCYKAQLLKTVRLPKLSGNTIGASWFNETALTTLVLGGNELNPLDNVSAFNKSPIQSGTGYIYVPDNLVETYKTATNWATFADNIKPISELEE